LKSLLDYTSRRTYLSLSFRDYSMNMLSRVFYCLLNRKQAKKAYLLKKGRDKIMKELDCVTILRKLRFLENMSSVLLNVP
jgi:hypothetical protein